MMQNVRQQEKTMTRKHDIYRYNRREKTNRQTSISQNPELGKARKGTSQTIRKEVPNGRKHDLTHMEKPAEHIQKIGITITLKY
jgi:hypothetical protein